ncbi:MAG: SusC/RagA family TonB-linked outer membrane protein [Chitinophagaceae bacterium]
MSKIKQILSVFFVLCGSFAMAQERSITGMVMGANKAPVASATVSQKGTKNATVTSDNGSFSIKVSGNNVVLIVSSVGFTPREIAVGAGSTTVEVNLADDSKQLGEVVVTALGISRQAKSLVYAAQVVKPAELTGVRDPNNILNSLQGKVANATITQGSGGVGSGARIVLRGNRSLQQSNNALIVVDGVPITNGTNGTAGSDFGSVQGSDGASSINPDDIESMTILRGASAAALYGSQAGNGVIVITTKKGTKDKTSISVNSGIVFESVFALPKVQNSYGQGGSGILDISSGESWGAKLTGQSITDYLGNPGTYTAQPDNIKDFFRTGVSLNNSIGISGGSEKMQTYLSYTNNNTQGVVPGNDLNRNIINLRISNQISKRLSTDAKITYINQKIDNRPRTGEENAPAIDIYQIPRNVSTEQAKNYKMVNNVGVDMPTAWPSTLNSIYQNPYWLINKSAINEKRDRLMGFLTAKYKITDWLSIQGRANIDKIFDRTETQYATGTILWASQAGGYYDNGNITTTKQWYDAMLEGNNVITKDLKIDYRVGFIFQDDKYEGLATTANGLNVTNKFSLNYATNPAITSAASQVQTQSVFGQVNLAWKNAIFLDASLRNDWDSRIGAPHTYQYPSVGVSAVLSDLFTVPAPFSFLKASVNYAEVGNGGLGQLLKPTYAYSQGSGNGFLQRGTTLPFPDLKPEIVKSYEAGIEARFINNRIGFTFTYYKSNSYNQLLRLDLPPASGYGSKYINAGNIQNKGIELVISGTPVRSRDFSWDVTFNLGVNRNKIVKLDPSITKTTLAGGYGRSGTPIVEEGGSFGDLVAFQWKRDSKGNFIVNPNGTPLTTDVAGEEQAYIGNFNPKATLGLTNTFDYKRFSVRILVDGRAGGVVISGTEMNLAYSGITEGTEQYRDAASWSLGGVDNTGAAVSSKISAQQFWQTASGKRYGVGEFFAYNATNFRVRELSIGYNIPVGSKFFIKDARFSLVARNLLWLYRGKSILDIPGVEKRKMWFDPDMSLGNGNYQGVEYGTLPGTRSLGVNLKLSF